MFETFDHTADLGIRCSAHDLHTLFAEAARALFSIIVEDLTTVRPVEHLVVSVKGNDREYLLFDWLRELLYCFDAERRLFSRFDLQVGEHGMTASAWGESYDPARHQLAHEVKAITYHQLKVEQTEDGWQAEFIVDI